MRKIDGKLYEVVSAEEAMVGDIVEYFQMNVRKQITGTNSKGELRARGTSENSWEVFGAVHPDLILREVKDGLSKFEVGDYVRIKDKYKDRYLITNERMLVARVEGVDVNGDFGDLFIKILMHESVFEIGHTVNVKSEYFEKVRFEEGEHKELYGIEVGKKYKALSVSEFGYFEEGDVVEVVGIESWRMTNGDEDAEFIRVQGGGFVGDFFSPSQIGEEVEENNPFEEGDLVVSIEDDAYVITNSRMTVGKVVTSEEALDEGDDIFVEVLIHEDEDVELYNRGEAFSVQSKRFRHLKKEDLPIKEGHKYKVTSDGEYGDILEDSEVVVEDIDLVVLEEEDEYFIYAKDEYGGTDWFRLDDLDEVKEVVEPTRTTLGVRDIVVVKDNHWFGHPIIGEVTRIDMHPESYRVKAVSERGSYVEYWFSPDDVTLICSKKDRKDLI